MKLDHDLVAYLRCSDGQGAGARYVPGMVVLPGLRRRNRRVSLFTTQSRLLSWAGLVYGYTPIPKEENVPLLHKPIFCAGVALVLFVILQVVFW